MTLTLSADDVGRVSAALQMLLTPLEHPSVEDWGRASMSVVQELLGADQWLFGGALPGGQPLVAVPSDPSAAAALRDYMDYYHELDTFITERRLELRMEVFTVHCLMTPGEIARDELYQDWAVPNHFCDALGMSVTVPENLTYPVLANFYHDNDAHPGWDERGKGIMYLLLPAFKSSVHTIRQLQVRRADLFHLVDRLPGGLLLFDLSGRLIHRNPSASEILGAELGPDRARLESEARQIALSVSSLLHRPQKAQRATMPVNPYRQVRGSKAEYRLAGSVLREALLEPVPLAAVTLERVTREPLSDHALRTRYNLTPREIQVARLLAEGKSDAEVAATLGVTRHTASRHAEHLRAKLRVRSRAAVGATIRNR
jgi:DNA-binding CsgD family transcriptional regulator/PAS domain-containing protein